MAFRLRADTGKCQPASFLRYYSDKRFVGDSRNFAIDAFRGPMNIRNRFNFDVTYAFSPRWSLSLDVPVQFQTYNLHRVVPASGSTLPVPVNTGANGLGDIILRAGAWLLSDEHMKGNIFVSPGMEFPTGSTDARSPVCGRQVPVDISVQPGNGAWGIIPTVEAFRTFRRFSVYGLATHLININPRNTTGAQAFFGALSNPATTMVNSGTDQYLALAGAALPLPRRFISVPPTLTYRFSGVPVQDLMGASDGFRRPANLQYIAPGVDANFHGQTISLTVPIVTYINVKPYIVNG